MIKERGPPRVDFNLLIVINILTKENRENRLVITPSGGFDHRSVAS